MVKSKIAIITTGVLLSQCIPVVAQDLTVGTSKSKNVNIGIDAPRVTTSAGVIIDMSSSSNSVDKPIGNAGLNEAVIPADNHVNSTTSAGVSVVSTVTEKAQTFLNSLYVDNSFPLYYRVVADEIEAIDYEVEVIVKVIDFKFEQSTYDIEGYIAYTLQLDSPEGLNTTTVSRAIPVKEKPKKGGSGGSGSSVGSDSTNTDTVPDIDLGTNPDIVSDMEVKLPSGDTVTIPKNESVWVKDTAGVWFHFNCGVSTTGWLRDNNRWYYLSSTGAMHTGWLFDSNNTWYYLSQDGSMKTGWHLDSNGKWYYLNSNGSMATNTYVDGYYVDSTGAWV